MLVEHYCDFNVNDDFWYETVIEDWQQKLEKEGFEDAEIRFSGFWCQGDGASFECSVNIYKFIENNAKEIIQHDIHNIFELRDLINESGNYKDIDLTARIEQSGRYCHENTMQVRGYNFFIDEDDNIDPQIQKFLEDTLEDWIEDYARDLAKEIYRSLREEYEYLTSKESVIEGLQANDIIDGNLDFVDPADSIYSEHEEYDLQAA